MRCRINRRCSSYNNMDKKIAYICENQYNYFLNKYNVNGIGLGYKIIRGFNTFQKCINVFVKKKKKEGNLSFSSIIPKRYKGIKTDVKEVGEITTDGLVDRVRPVIQGYSSSPAPYGKSYTISGTSGCLVTDGKDNYLLSSNHVIADYGAVPIGHAILQPGRGDGGRIVEDDVAVLSKYIPIKYISTFRTPTNYVDCAIAKVTQKSIATSEIAIVGKPHAIIKPILNKSIMKVGKTTALTKGTVTSINVTMTVGDSKMGKVSLMKKQISTTKISTFGDSGAVLLDEDKNVMGLVMASSDTVSTCNEINEVLKALNVRIVTD